MACGLSHLHSITVARRARRLARARSRRAPPLDPLQHELHAPDALARAGENAVTGVGKPHKIHRRAAQLLEPDKQLFALRDGAAIIVLGSDNAQWRGHLAGMRQRRALAIELLILPGPAI